MEDDKQNSITEVEENEVIANEEQSEVNLAKEWEEKYLRSLADYQNLLKQTAKEKIDAIKYANESLLEELLPVYSNLKIAISKDSNTGDAWFEGVKYVTKQFKDALLTNGVVEIETVGKVFDHEVMEAIEEEATSEESKDSQVAREAAAGYLLNGRVVIPAKVVVYRLQK